MQLLLWDEDGKPNYRNDDWHQLVLENTKLIHWAVNHLKAKHSILQCLDDDAARSTASLALTNAATMYRSHKGTRFTSYAVTCIQNALFYEANKQLKREKRERLIGECTLHQIPEDIFTPDDSGLEEQILEVCREMPRKMRVVVISRFLRDFSIPKIADVYNLKKTKVAVMIKEGTKILRERLHGRLQAESI